jgi:hypothetical protein
LAGAVDVGEAAAIATWRALAEAEEEDDEAECIIVQNGNGQPLTGNRYRERRWLDTGVDRPKSNGL